MTESNTHILHLWITVCRLIAHSPAYQLNFPVWRSKSDFDGKSMGDDFVLGLNLDNGIKIGYLLPMEYWDKTWFADTLPKGFDVGQSSNEMLKLIETII
jgi:hypothetical protein